MLEILYWILAFIIAITVHEAAHAYMANRLGDPTPKMMGRLSLNPMVHYDPVGTTLLLVLVLLRAIGLPVIPFGWAKPVIFDPFNLEDPKRDSALISLAGPFSNLLLATILALIYRIYPFSFFTPIVLLNVVLAVFNLVPIHPLDGGKILVGILPSDKSRSVDIFLHRYGMILLFLLIFPTIGGTSPLFLIIGPVLNVIFNLLKVPLI